MKPIVLQSSKEFCGAVQQLGWCEFFQSYGHACECDAGHEQQDKTHFCECGLEWDVIEFNGQRF